MIWYQSLNMFLFLFVFAYMIGNILGAKIVGIYYKVDIGDTGSKNLGATNAIRAVGRNGAIAVFLIDFLKGFLGGFAILGLGMIFTKGASNPAIPLAMTGIVVGHCFPVMNNFKGGKGVSTTWGVLVVFNWVLALVAVIVFFTIVKITKISSLSTLLTWWSIFLLSWIPVFWQNGDFILLLSQMQIMATPIAITLLLLLVTFKHRTNIVKIINGTEGSSSLKKTPA